MSISAIRYVRHCHDGVDRYQCLSCYKDIDSYTRPFWSSSFVAESGDRVETTEMVWKFCPYCGIKWDRAIPYKSRWDNDHYETMREAEERNDQRLRNLPYFVIQKRSYYKDLGFDEMIRWSDEYGDWRLSGVGTAAAVYDDLQKCRAYTEKRRIQDPDYYEGLTVEYRVVLMRKKEKGFVVHKIIEREEEEKQNARPNEMQQ